MTIESWLRAAVADAEARGLPQLKAMLETLAKSTAALRAADFNERADGTATRDRRPPAGGQP